MRLLSFYNAVPVNLKMTYCHFQILLQSSGDLNQFPDRQDEFLGKKFIFKIQINDRNIRGYNSDYIVMRMTNEEDLTTVYELLQQVGHHIDFYFILL